MYPRIVLEVYICFLLPSTISNLFFIFTPVTNFIISKTLEMFNKPVFHGSTSLLEKVYWRTFRRNSQNLMFCSSNWRRWRHTIIIGKYEESMTVESIYLMVFSSLSRFLESYGYLGDIRWVFCMLFMQVKVWYLAIFCQFIKIQSPKMKMSWLNFQKFSQSNYIYVVYLFLYWSNFCFPFTYLLFSF